MSIAEVKRWLESVPASDDRHTPVSNPAPSWEAWAAGGRDAETELISILRTDSDPVWRGRAAMALGFVGTPAALEPLVAALRDEPMVAMEAAATLGRLALAESIDALCAALQHDDANVRANAATALGTFSTETARKCLRAAAENDPSDFVRRAANEALQRQQR